MLLYTRALAVNPTSFAVLNNMGWLEESSGDEARLSVAQGHYAAALALVRPRKTFTLQQPQVRARRDEGRRGDRHMLTFFLAAHTLHSALSLSHYPLSGAVARAGAREPRTHHATARGGGRVAAVVVERHK